MKKNYPRTWLLASLSFISTASLAYGPILTTITFTCPCVNSITKVTDHLEGNGTEFIIDNNNPIIFKSSDLPANIPGDFSNYSVEAINYYSTQGSVVCTYESSDSSQSPVSLSYFIMNGIGGTVQAHSNNSIMIRFPLGVKIT
ncbi:MAG: hypothetical protein WC627_02485 [Legionella sp.]|jgi:hypothetical protein